MSGFLVSMQGAVSQGVIWGIMALGVYITFRIMDIADRVLGKEQKNRMDIDEFRLLPQERLNPGIMGGYGGILLYLLQKIN